MTRVWVGLGSNIKRTVHLRNAVAALRKRFGEVVLSPLYESRAVGFDGGDFYNLVACFHTDLAVRQVVAFLYAVEADAGRVRADAASSHGRGGRTLDADLLLYGELVRHDDTLDVPRRDLLEYDFVLRPLSELAPHLVHPETGLSFARHWRDFRGAGNGLCPVVMDWDGLDDGA